ncbi:MAG: translation initiation factor IF-2 [Deltaproteobacteria bacterium]|nr:translation initiation factor IF-2 [Deltaproteobacteria bacterium]MBW2150375.1 translation initiation factor IF-2 [Deltaproteobacteria bacterium]
MAKIRVYELARDLNLDNKALLEKIAEMNISVKSHMSSLEDDVVAKIKTNIFGKQTDMIEVTRVKPTVIRRRKKRIQIEEVQAAEPEAIAESQEALKEPAEEVSKEEAKPAPKEAVRVEAEAIAEQKPTPEAPPAVERLDREIPTKIEPEVVEAEKPKEKAPPAVEPEAPVLKEKPKPVRKRKEKRETPAKIIKLPVKPKVEPEEEKPAPEPVVSKEQEAEIAELPPAKEALPEEVPVPEKAPVKEKKKKKGKKKEEEDFKDAKFFKKKISFRKKEVIEGEDLYADIPKRTRKARPAAKAAVAKGQKPHITTPKAIKRRIKIDETIVLADLAKRMGIKANEMIAKLMSLGVMATVNQTIDFETAALVASEFDYEVEKASFEEEAFLKVVRDEPGKLIERPPVVTIMGHVDHGKTSLLDVIRKTRVTEAEAGGITQHIGAYLVETDKGRIVFLDTPGHEAFTAMRSRGAQVTDIVVLVVAADDGVMAQTIEAINHARAADVSIIVAINKIDKANADPDRVIRELAEEGLVPEDWGGETIFVKVSAKTHEGLDELLEMISLQAEILELKANPSKLAEGHVIEAKLDAGRGPVATVLIREGTLRTGDSIVCGVHFGKVRAMLNDRGEPVQEAGPSMPVEVLGLSGVPMAGDELNALEDEKIAKQVSAHRMQKQRAKELARSSRLSLDKLFENLKEGEVKDLNIIIKADVNGSIEALRDSLTKLSNEEVKINIIHSATGTITESDVSLAAVSDAIIIGFNVRPTLKVQELAAEENVDMRFYNVIYEVIKDVQDALVGMMASRFEERILGRAEVRQIFQIPKVGTIAGCYVTHGKIERGRQIRVLRDGVVSYEGKIASLRRYKDDAREVASGYECGIGIENYNDIKVGDILECFYLEEVKPQLNA